MNTGKRRLGTVVELRSHRGYQPDYAALARNRIVMARADTGLSADEFAAMLSPLVGRPISAGHVVSWEADVTPPGDVLVAAMAVSPSSESRLGVRSHKFIAAYLMPDAVRGLSGLGVATPKEIHGSVSCWPIGAEELSGDCHLYAWPFGSVIFHRVEDLNLPDIASLALWRIQSYVDDLSWATQKLRALTGDPESVASYVLSAYWVHTPIWAGRILESALRIICSPRVLLDRELHDVESCQSSARRAERELLAEGFSPPEMTSFGLRGVASGYASWSGVVYHPYEPERALAEKEIVSLELALQSIWVYCEYINSQVEKGIELSIPDGYGCSFLRAARSRLLNPRPQETGQHRSMRDAIVQTSGLPAHLALAMDAVKEAKGR